RCDGVHAEKEMPPEFGGLHRIGAARDAVRIERIEPGKHQVEGEEARSENEEELRPAEAQQLMIEVRERPARTPKRTDAHHAVLAHRSAEPDCIDRRS